MKLFFLFWLYTFLVSVSIQWIVIPKWVPHLHAGEGLLVNTDAVLFHKEALKLEKAIHEEGWSAWNKDSVAGGWPVRFTALNYYLFFPKPWVLLPWNALWHAGAALALYFILMSFSFPPSVSLFSSLPFLVFPSAFAWVAQIHRDGIYILGVFLFLLAWLKILQKTDKASTALISGVLLLTGIFCVGISRSHILVLFFIYSCLMLGPTLFLLIQKNKHHLGVSLIILLSIALSFLCIQKLRTQSTEQKSLQHLQTKSDPQLYRKWEKSKLLPSFIDQRLNLIAVQRNSFHVLYPKEASHIDTDVRFTSAKDIFLYIPRALQIALFAPFPNRWFPSQVHTEGGRLRQWFASIEMIFVYLALGSLFFFISRILHLPQTWALAGFCLLTLIVLGLSVPLLGALYRYRYAYLMPLVSLGVALFLARDRRSHNLPNLKE